MSLIDPSQSSSRADGSVGIEEELRAFVGPNADHYLARWQRMAETGNTVSWHWPAALLTGFWLLYRRQYGWFALYFGAWFVVLVTALTAPVFMLAKTLGFGLFGDWLYLQFVRGRLAVLARRHPDRATRILAAAREGGVSFAAPAVWAVLLLLFFGGMILLFGAAIMWAFASFHQFGIWHHIRGGGGVPI